MIRLERNVQFNSVCPKGVVKLENFFTLRAEKQNHIIDAALAVFGRSGYKKASIADIADKAHITKSNVLYYFGSKKNLYLYCAERCYDILEKEMEKGYDTSVTEFFDRTKMLAEIKLAAMKHHPGINTFLTNLYYEDDKEVREELNQFIKKGLSQREKWLVTEADVSRFKDDIDPKLLDKFFVWVAEGFASGIQREDEASQMEQTELFMQEFYLCMDWMKKYFYKGEN